MLEWLRRFYCAIVVAELDCPELHASYEVLGLHASHTTAYLRLAFCDTVVHRYTHELNKKDQEVLKLPRAVSRKDVDLLR